jgi:hypothetical protein
MLHRVYTFKLFLTILLRPLKNPTVSATLQKRIGFYEVTGVRALFFAIYLWGETAAPSLSRGMRRGQNSPVDILLKKVARKPWN